MRTAQLPLLVALPLASLAGCTWNTVEDGRLGRLQMTPSACGQAGCNLGDGIAVGGALDLTLRGKTGVDASDLHLVSSAPWIVEVLSTEATGSEPRFRIVGDGAGLADLIAVDRYGYQVDYLPVEVATIAGFDIGATADGMTESTVPGLGEVFEVAAGTDVHLEVDGTSRGRALTGDVQLLVELDAALAAAMLPGSDPARGQLHFKAPLGTHDLTITAPGGARELVRVVGAGPLQPTR